MTREGLSKIEEMDKKQRIKTDEIQSAFSKIRGLEDELDKVKNECFGLKTQINQLMALRNDTIAKSSSMKPELSAIDGNMKKIEEKSNDYKEKEYLLKIEMLGNALIESQTTLDKLKTQEKV